MLQICYSRRVAVWRTPSHYHSGLELSHSPVLPTVVSVEFGQETVEKLVVNPNVFSVLPLDHSKVVSGSDGRNDNSRVPGPGVSGVDDMAMKIAPVDLKLYCTESKSAERSSTGRLTRVESTFDRR